MKKLIIVILFLLTLLSITACGQTAIEAEIEEENNPIVEETLPIIEEPIVEEPIIEQELNEGLGDFKVKHKRKPKQSTPRFVDFDAYFTTTKVPAGQMVQLLDAGYIIYYFGDYFHHNTRSFLNIFWQCTAGTQVKIFGNIYTSGGIYHGYVENSMIWYDNGEASWYENSITELITCDGGKNTQLRWILRLY